VKGKHFFILDANIRRFLMKYLKFAAVAAFGLAGILAGCSSSDSSSETSAVGPGETVSFDVARCNSDIDAVYASRLDASKKSLVDFFGALVDGDLTRSQALASNLKSTYGQVLANYPANCEAQLGYALSSIADLVNDPGLNSLVDTLENRGITELKSSKNLYRMSSDDASQVIVGSSYLLKNSSGSVIVDVQNSIASHLLPVTDSAITYLTNVVHSGDVAILYKTDSRTYELDKGEFAPALGALHLFRAIMVCIASYDIDFTKNGGFTWIEELDDMDVSNYKTNAGGAQLLALMDRSNPFGSIKSDWVSMYKSIPNMLDSAISYVQLGLQYGIDESATGLASQINDIYVVGDGVDADVSAADMKRAIDSLEVIKKALHNDVEITINGKKVVVNLGKFFNITNIKQYLPYYRVVPQADWYKEMGHDFWSEDMVEDSYSREELESKVKSLLVTRGNEDYYDVQVEHYYYDHSSYKYQYGIYVRVYARYDNYYTYAYYKATMDGCNAVLSLLDEESYYGYNGSGKEGPGPLAPSTNTIPLSSEFCLVEDGVTKFRTSVGGTAPNWFVFTDAQGNTTLSLKQMNDGVWVTNSWGSGYRGYTNSELKEYVHFPDVTFGGVLPGMTKDALWDLFVEDDDDDDDDIYAYPESSIYY